VGSILQLCSIEPPAPVQSSEWPPEIQHLLQQYQALFEHPSQLPPSRSCDHAIPLIPGAGPIFSRSYHFAPTIKDEIEKQVHEMLAAGLIQKSSSPFSSPMLLVKKDNTWQLNAITMKSKYPILLLMTC
jgi:hypothetical protein